jgi:hypothetical protein
MEAFGAESGLVFSTPKASQRLKDSQSSSQCCGQLKEVQTQQGIAGSNENGISCSAHEDSGEMEDGEGDDTVLLNSLTSQKFDLKHRQWT